ncbi:hypothetical protein HanIR_Chr05g0233611 [Helianthus annuus]|nr:hypothetical protein HanIR_Chr05g0233611 [Helianthus annuus]
MASCMCLIWRSSFSPERPRSEEDWTSAVREDMEVRSMPEQKWLPVPDKRMRATLGFWSRDDMALGNSVKNWRESALLWCGRLRERVKTGELGFC